ncbi:HEPN domain-containing protein [Mycolicibacterium porcinum]|uniref:HEPN domain-containing protein n=1 Tax=Mycolicibacterium porcinum TaxID=39693 RepID=UPI001041D652|nr:HEPN domain-containing protein [Mycolicibacterium porcinum]
MQLRATVDHLPPETDDEIKASLARFLAVRSCGHIEFAFDECLSQFAVAKAHPSIAGYVRGGLFNGRNPHPEVLVKRLRMLKPEWADEFSVYLEEDDNFRSRELGLLVTRRNGISHGQNEGLTQRKSLDLASLALDVADWLSERLRPAQE